jgi:hypothetical protein
LRQARGIRLNERILLHDRNSLLFLSFTLAVLLGQAASTIFAFAPALLGMQRRYAESKAIELLTRKLAQITLPESRSQVSRGQGKRIRTFQVLIRFNPGQLDFCPLWRQKQFIPFKGLS